MAGAKEAEDAKNILTTGWVGGGGGADCIRNRGRELCEGIGDGLSWKLKSEVPMALPMGPKRLAEGCWDC